MTVSMSVWRNPDQERTNQNARIFLKTTLPYNKGQYWKHGKEHITAASHCIVII